MTDLGIIKYGLNQIMEEIIRLRADTEYIKEAMMKKSAEELANYIMDNVDAYKRFNEVMNK